MSYKGSSPQRGRRTKEFSFSTIEKFDDHIDQSIIGYKELTDAVKKLANYFIDDKTFVYDIGCSTGKLIKEMAPSYPETKFFGIEISDNFKKDNISKENVVFFNDDIFRVNIHNAGVVLSLFTIQFMPLYQRIEVIRKIFVGLVKGGALIIAEKLNCEDVRIDNMLTFLYYDYKRTIFTDEEILDKENDLRKIMKLGSYSEYTKVLKEIGFNKVDVFWKRYKFTGLIAIK